MRLPLSLAVATIALVLSGAQSVRADVFGAIELGSAGHVSVEGVPTRLEQALYAHDPAISGDGRYVVFDGYFGGRTGVWRRELQPPFQIQPVAVGAVEPGSEACVAESACDAELPSISENGQFVSFTTTAQLDPANSTGAAANVYVRNMDVPESQPCQEETSLAPVVPCAFTLVSAVSGATEGLSYEGGGSDEYGSLAAGRSAISANGQQVAFVTTARSNLAGPGTPALQVAVRNRASGETELVSTEYDPVTGQAVPGHPVSQADSSSTYGAVYSPGSTVPSFPFNNRAYSMPPALGASISADGSTVAWMGRVLGAQVRLLPGERLAPSYAEPLWRRIADGPLAPTRRVTGGSQPEAAACVEAGEQALPGLAQQTLGDPCQGPFAVESQGTWAGAVGNAIPQLSADGDTVAFLSRAPLISLGSDYGRSAEGEADDLYVANMQEGLTRTEALRPLTQLASGHETDPASDAPIVDVAVSADGTQVAFATERTEFPLGSPAYISPPRTVAGMSELYDVNLADETVTRVSNGYEGGPSERSHKTVQAGETDPYVHRTDGALSPAFSSDGNTLVFASTASNLVYGDANTVAGEASGGSADASSVYAVSRSQFGQASTETYTSKPPPTPEIPQQWKLFSSAVSLPDGKVRITFETPASGVISAYVKSAVPNTGAASVARASARHGTARARAALVSRYVAIGFAWPQGRYGAFTTITLALGSSFAKLAARAGGLAGVAKITFAPDDVGEPAIVQRLPVVFKRTIHAHGHGTGRGQASRRR